jgi:hypothetical protein
MEELIIVVDSMVFTMAAIQVEHLEVTVQIDYVATQNLSNTTREEPPYYSS